VAIGLLAIVAGFGVTYRARADWMPDADPARPAIVTPTDIPDTDLAEPSRISPTQTRTIYRADLFCQTLEPQAVELSIEGNTGDRQAEIEAAIGVMLKQWTGSDLGIAGYRVTLRDRVATVDIRRDPNAARPWMALSTCEQFALFGGLRETMTNEPDWGIDRVEFLSLGEPLGF
jgi:hypothetical protein